jgi:hypothetical protein
MSRAEFNSVRVNQISVAELIESTEVADGGCCSRLYTFSRRHGDGTDFSLVRFDGPYHIGRSSS